MTTLLTNMLQNEYVSDQFVEQKLPKMKLIMEIKLHGYFWRLVKWWKLRIRKLKLLTYLYPCSDIQLNYYRNDSRVLLCHLHTLFLVFALQLNKKNWNNYSVFSINILKKNIILLSRGELISCYWKIELN